MKVAIVEDEKWVADELKNMFERYASANDMIIESEHFSAGIAFLENYRFCYDIVFMDINLGDMNGMNVAKRLRECGGNVLVIFVTNMAQFALKGYEVNAFDFIVKPVIFNHLCQVLDRAKKLIEFNGNVPKICISALDKTVMVNAEKISYIEIINHTLYYHIGEEILKATGKLSELEQKLKKHGFVRCNNGYLVNLRFVRSIEGYTVDVGGNLLQISRPKRQALMKALTQFMNGGLL